MLLPSPQIDDNVIVVTPRRNPYTDEIELDPFGDFGRYIFSRVERYRKKVNRCRAESGLSQEQADTVVGLIGLGSELGRRGGATVFWQEQQELVFLEPVQRR